MCMYLYSLLRPPLNLSCEVCGALTFEIGRMHQHHHAIVRTARRTGQNYDVCMWVLSPVCFTCMRYKTLLK